MMESKYYIFICSILQKRTPSSWCWGAPLRIAFDWIDCQHFGSYHLNLTWWNRRNSLNDQRGLHSRVIHMAFHAKLLKGRTYHQRALAISAKSAALCNILGMLLLAGLVSVCMVMGLHTLFQKAEQVCSSARWIVHWKLKNCAIISCCQYLNPIRAKLYKTKKYQIEILQMQKFHSGTIWLISTKSLWLS